MSSSENQIEEDKDYKLLTYRGRTHTLKASLISYFLTLLIPTVTVGSFLYFMKDHMVNSKMKNVSVNKKDSSGIAGFILDNFNKADKNMNVLNKPKAIEKPKYKVSKLSRTYKKSKIRKNKVVKPKKTYTYTSRILNPGQTKMTIIVVEKK